MKRFRPSIFNLTLMLLTLVSATPAFAALHAMAWEPGGTMAPLVIFVRDSETPERAAQRYLQNLQHDPGMMELLAGRLPDLQMQGFREISDAELKSSALLVANNAYDFTDKSRRLKQFQNVFHQAGAKLLILPLRADIGLPINESRELKRLVAEKFPLLVPMGGEDVEPDLYGQEPTLARQTVRSRDQFEISLIQQYVRTAKGFLFGICRGQQITAVALGYQLIQDIPTLFDHPDVHASGYHEIILRETTHGILQEVFPQGHGTVNSYHHQAVRFQTGGALEVAAVGEDGIVEALELKNGKGLLVQFHPEAMNSPAGQSIINQIIRIKNKSFGLACGKVYSH